MDETAWLVWYDGNPARSLLERIQCGADYYRQKHGRVPTVCQVNPGEGPAPDRLAGISVRNNSMVLPGHLWLGVEEV